MIGIALLLICGVLLWNSLHFPALVVGSFGLAFVIQKLQDRKNQKPRANILYLPKTYIEIDGEKHPIYQSDGTWTKEVRGGKLTLTRKGGFTEITYIEKTD